jgi:ribose transport system permease protein
MMSRPIESKPSSTSSRWRQRLAFSRISAVYVWLGIIVLFGVWVPETFLTSTTVVALAADNSITTIVALGLIVALAAGVFDLSIGAVLGSSAVLCAYLMVKQDVHPVLAIVITLLYGAAVGTVNAVLIVRFKVDSFIATLAMSSVLVAFQEWLTGNQQIIGLSPGFKNLSTLKPLGIPITFFYMVIVALGLWYVLQLTPIGRFLYATGGNREIARLAGLRPSRWVAVSLVTSSLVASAAGVLVLARVSGAGPTLGGTYLLPVFAAAFLGATQFVPGRFNVWGTVVAVFLLATGSKGLQLVGFQPWVNKMFYGVVLALAVILSQASRARRRTTVVTDDPANAEEASRVQ